MRNQTKTVPVFFFLCWKDVKIDHVKPPSSGDVTKINDTL